VLVLFVAFIVVPIAELYVFVQASHAFGFWLTLAAVIGISLFGGWLIKHQGMRVWRRFNDQLSQGVIPSREIADGVLVLIGGALLLTPGFLTDIVGLFVILPPTRAVARRLLIRRFRIVDITPRRPGPYGPGSTSPGRTTVIDVEGEPDDA
jgi:UPF0716 protein FxsA